MRLLTALLLVSSTACAQFATPLRIKNNGTIVTPTRYFLNCVGVGVSCVDDPAQLATDITVNAGAGGTLQQAYNNGGAGITKITLDSTRLGIAIVDNATPVGGDLFAVQNNAGTTKYIEVTAGIVRLNGGSGASGSLVVITGGTGTAGSGGNATLKGGTGTTTGGHTVVVGGEAQGGTAGVVSIDAGDDGTNGGTVNIGIGDVFGFPAAAINLGTGAVAADPTALNIGVATNFTMGFYGATAVARQNTTGTTQQTAAGVGTAIKTDSTSTGGVGATAYTTADVIRALKQYGLLAQ